jgi:peptidyl-tRNA hydrolase ICT1
MHPHLRASKYYVKGKDCVSFAAQTKRDRNANAEENREKLLEELQKIYSDAVPGDTSVEKRKKHGALSVMYPKYPVFARPYTETATGKKRLGSRD